MNNISIVILNWNGSAMLRTYMPSVIHYSQSEKIEICVADNGSTDNSVEMLKHNFPSVRLILLDKNYGFAEGYNLALKEVEAEYVILLNSDVEVTPNWLKPLTEYMNNHPEVAACQPKILNCRNKKQFEYAGAAGGFIDYYGYPFCRGRIFKTIEDDKGQYNSPIPVFWATGAALFIRLDDYRKAGGLDASFFAHMEEIDLCWRLHSRGRQIMCLPQSTVYHVGGATLKKENPYKTLLNFRNNLIMLYKNLPDDELKRVMRVRWILDYIAVATFVLKGQLPNALAVFKARREFKRLRSRYDAARKNNKINSRCTFIAERLQKSILRQYYLNGYHTFDRIKQKS
jgi:GT2 family glycosyltransferase